MTSCLLWVVGIHLISGRHQSPWRHCPAGGKSSSSIHNVCCDSACGSCGGRGCDQRPGGRDRCCASEVIQSNQPCSLSPPPCVPIPNTCPTCNASARQRSGMHSRDGVGASAIYRFMVRTCSGSSESVATAARAFPRTIGIGLPHTGTSTLHVSLLQLGCCFATHNHQEHQRGERMKCGESSETLAARLADRFDRSQANHRTVSLAEGLSCEPRVLQEAERWQCLSDDPWATHYAALGKKYPDAKLVLTRFPTPLHYGVSALSRGAGRIAFPNGIPNATDAMRPFVLQQARFYFEHNRNVRKMFGQDPRFVEICWPCGDTVSTLAAKLAVGFDATELQAAPARIRDHRAIFIEHKRILMSKIKELDCLSTSWLCRP